MGTGWHAHARSCGLPLPLTLDYHNSPANPGICTTMQILSPELQLIIIAKLGPSDIVRLQAVGAIESYLDEARPLTGCADLQAVLQSY